MNVFSLLDEAIRGTIRFVFSYIHSTFLLYLQPFSGPPRLEGRVRDPQSDQISSLTYLAVSILIATFALLDDSTLGPEGRTGFLASQARAVSRGEMSGLGALVGGTLAGTFFVAGALRVAVFLAGLRDEKRAAFLATGEYLFGLLALGVSAWMLVLGSLELDVDERILAGVFLLSAVVLVFLPSAVTSVHLWDLLLDTERGRGWTKDFAAATGTLLRHPKRGFAEWRDLYERFTGTTREERMRPKHQARLLLWGPLAYFAIVLPLLLAGLAVEGGVYASGWLLDERKPGVRLLGLRCAADASAATASAVAFNDSDEPAADWLPDTLTLGITLVTPGDSRVGTAEWGAAPTSGAKSDFIGPKLAMELSGPLHLPAQARKALSAGARLECALHEPAY